MKTSSYSAAKVRKVFDKFFDKNVINRLAMDSKFSLRTDARIPPFAFIVGLIESCFTRFNTYSSWASAIGTFIGKEVSKQALFKRMNSRTEALASKIFSHVLKDRLISVKDSRLFDLFKRVLLQDSTTLSLPQNLVEFFPGNVAGGEQKAVARLQCIINVKSMQWLHLALKSFTNNDQSASGEALPLLMKGDLLIRDLGYFVLYALSEIIKKKAFFISRLQYRVTIYEETGKEISWKELCKKKGIVDKKILIGKKEKIPVRIIMIPLPTDQVAERTRKARTDRDKRVNHSADFYEWIKYNVFICNVSEDTLSSKEIGEVYKVRWQVEILFKSWKSGGHLQAILHERCTNIYRVRITIYLLLMLFCMIMRSVYMKHYKHIEKHYGRCLSLIKSLAYVCNNFLKVIDSSEKKLREQLYKHCCYEKRKKRTNMAQFINAI